MLKKGQTMWLVKSYIVTQAEQGQTPKRSKEDTQSITVWSFDMDTGASVGDTEKAGRKADSVQSMENRQFYKNQPF